jgi:hypothetical protein
MTPTGRTGMAIVIPAELLAPGRGGHDAASRYFDD